MKRFLYLVLTLISLQSCAKYTILVDERGDNLELYDYYIDDCGNEGIVVCQNLSKKWILVMSTDEEELPWGQTGQLLFDSLSSVTKEFKNGILMLNLMMNHGIEHYPAQAWCMAKNGSDIPHTGSWHLPSHYEWSEFVCRNETNVQHINQALDRIGGTLLNLDEYYWTCTEDYEDYWEFSSTEADYDPKNRAINESPLIRALVHKELWHKKQYHKVRAVRYVYYKD